MILYRPLHLEKIECIFFNVLDIFRKEYGQFFDYLKENEKGFFLLLFYIKMYNWNKIFKDLIVCLGLRTIKLDLLS